ncbi:MAG: M1 family metallopeptidase [Ilyomonas sp.]
MRKVLFCLLLLCSVAASAQFTVVSEKDTSWKKIYRATEPKINDLVHTKLDVRFNYDKAYLYGKAWITLHPHIYPTDSLTLDAKGMNINEVALVQNNKKVPLKYTYDSLKLRITLDKKYKENENYTVYIDYVSKPNEFKTHGSAAITDAKGLYFINPKGEEKNKPTQIWTQGETEGTSVWCPTIDHPNQKCTDEISMTVPAKYVTLSNGILTYKKNNNDGTRTDTWKIDKPHSPYLFFMGVGDYAVIKDSYKGKQVNYYVEKEYAPVARKIFGLTPEMIKAFSTLLNYDYPWQKYDQMTARDYVSGAMENTTATLHTDALQQNARELTDGNKYEDYVSHELFHQWFGDLVTAESWSNITVNESFADYGEYLWREYKYGKENADKSNYENMQAYLNSGSEDKNLVRFYYRDKEDVFDLVSYQKGGCILNMLRNYIGDSAFFKGLNLYLNTYKYGNAEAHQLRLALEQVSGQDLNWFFNQWYFGSGNPSLDISYHYDAAKKTAKVFIRQMQQSNKVFQLPVAIDIYEGNTKKRYHVWLNNREDTFSFPADTKPDLINTDADKILITEKNDHKTMTEFAFQFSHAGNYVDKREAIEFAGAHFDEPEAKKVLLFALNDPFEGIRKDALKNLAGKQLDNELITKVEAIAKTDNNRPNRAYAIDLLGELKNKSYEDFFVKNTSDSSYTVAGAALDALAAIDEQKAISLLPQLKNNARGRLQDAVSAVDFLTRNDADFDSLFVDYKNTKLFDKFNATPLFILYLKNVDSSANFKKAVDEILNFVDTAATYSAAYKEEMINQLKALKQYKQSKKQNVTADNSLNEEINYLDEKLKG